MKRTFWSCPRLDDPGTFEEKMEHTSERSQTSERKANLVSSWTGKHDWHMPVLDIDVPARLIPSTTPGHSHLYIDVDCTWEEYQHLLDALLVCGIIEPGYHDASIRRKQTFVRKPGVKKASGAPDSSDGPKKSKGDRSMKKKVSYT